MQVLTLLIQNERVDFGATGISLEGVGSYRDFSQTGGDVAGAEWGRLSGMLHAEEFVSSLNQAWKQKVLTQLRWQTPAP